MTINQMNLYVTGLFLCLLIANGTRGAETNTRMLTQPAISDRHVAFVYDRDLWIASPEELSNNRDTTVLESTASNQGET